VEEKLAVPAELSRYSVPAGCMPIVQRLARISEVVPVDRVSEGAGSRSSSHFDVAILYERKIEAAAECERLAKELVRLEKEAANAERQLANTDFLNKAPEAVVNGLRKRAGELTLLIPKTRAAMASLNCGKNG
jgi:valyl-tRNA synthetase